MIDANPSSTEPGEREWLILWQQIEASYGNKKVCCILTHMPPVPGISGNQCNPHPHKERCTNVLEGYGYPTGSHSASAYTTALPVAITARMMLDGESIPLHVM